MKNHKASMHWFKKHPDFLRRESTALSNNSNYQEIHQCRDNVFLSHGNIIVRLEKVYRHPVLIIYTDATPYQLPIIFPLKDELTAQEVEALSKLRIDEICLNIKPRVIYYHRLRHQNGSGALCVLESAELDSGAKFYTIGSILNRLRDWYAGHVTGNFPPDNEEVEFCAHFSHIHNELEFLYPIAFNDRHLIAGQFYATLIRQFAGNHFIYHGSLIDGQTKSGIQNNGTYLLKELLNDRLKTSIDFQTQLQLVDPLIESKQLLIGIWFHVETILTPFDGFTELIRIVGSGDFETGVQHFSKTASSFFRHLHDKFIVGIRYPNKRGELEFQLFEVSKKADLSELYLGPDPLEKMKSILNRYEGVAAIWSEQLSSENFHLRNSLRAKRDILMQQNVNILGVGSLGSEIADCLSKAGAGVINLLDNQVIRAHNAIRHVAGLGYIGISKSLAMKEIMFEHNPFVTVNPIHLNIYFAPDLMLTLPEKSITISSIADDNVEAFINEQAVIAGKTVFYARALRGGKVGRIFRVTPGQDACFQCLSLYLSEQDSKFRIEEDETFPVLKNECNNPIRPASAADLKIIGSIAARLVIDHMQEGASVHNHWIWSTEKLPSNGINVPFSLHQDFLPPHANCYYCNPDEKLTVTINNDVIQFMQKLVEERKGTETGGVLAGIVEPSGNVHIISASEPGPKAVHKTTEFRKDVEFCQEFLDKIYTESEQKIVYIGEWHSHPSSDNRPSGLDILSLSEISQQKEYLTTNPLMIIFSSTGSPSCTFHPAGKAHYFVDLNIVKKSVAA